MNLLVSDYDGTFKSNLKNLKINITKISKFIEEGNKFVIATGREFNSIKREIIKYNIPYNYLVCNSGLVIFDSNDEVVYSSILKEDDIHFIYKNLDMSLNNYNTRLYNLYTQTSKLDEVLEVYVEFEDLIGIKELKHHIESMRPDLICNQINNKLFIGHNLNKSTAIEFLMNKENIEKEKIYTIGNDLNDLEMLLNFNGYKMLKCNKKLLFRGIPTSRQVHTLIKKIT